MLIDLDAVMAVTALVGSVLMMLVTAHGALKVSFYVVPCLAGGLIVAVLGATVVGIEHLAIR